VQHAAERMSYKLRCGTGFQGFPSLRLRLHDGLLILLQRLMPMHSFVSRTKFAMFLGQFSLRNRRTDLDTSPRSYMYFESSSKHVVCCYRKWREAFGHAVRRATAGRSLNHGCTSAACQCALSLALRCALAEAKRLVAPQSVQRAPESLQLLRRRAGCFVRWAATVGAQPCRNIAPESTSFFWQLAAQLHEICGYNLSHASWDHAHAAATPHRRHLGLTDLIPMNTIDASQNSESLHIRRKMLPLDISRDDSGHLPEILFRAAEFCKMARNTSLPEEKGLELSRFWYDLELHVWFSASVSQGFAKLRFATAESKPPKGFQNRLSHVISIVFDGES